MQFFFLTSFMILSLALSAQDSIEGLWEISKVKVGEQEMTPRAKWTRINSDGTFESGNGWLQHSTGICLFDSASSKIQFIDRLGIEDEFDGFTLSSKDSITIWSRIENGIEIKVYTKRIDKIPMATQDYLVGMWELNQIEKDSAILDLETKETIYLRWDREYRKWMDGKRSRGFWHMNAHRPILNIIDGENLNSWEVFKVDKEQLILVDSKNAFKKSYSRKNKFPIQ